MQRRTLAIANRGEIAIRIARTARECGWRPVVLLGDPDLNSYVTSEIPDVVQLGPAGNELVPEIVVAAAQQAGAEALHPGYGFLSERPELSRLCEQAGITFVGPSPETLELAGDKIATREIAEQLGLPLIAASESLSLDEPDQWIAAANAVTYPLMVKVAEAGGGRGLRVVRKADELAAAVQSALNEAGMSGASASFFFERFLERARHVEVQIAGDGSKALALGDRDCSLQRRHQKVIEEAPAPGLSGEQRTVLWADAVNICEAIKLKGLATVEFLLDQSGNHIFMEINPRLQVEHTVTEAVTGMDLVAIQLDIATGKQLPDPVVMTGHAIQARLYAEDPFRQFLPSPGEICHLEFPHDPWVRIDAGYASHDMVPSHYDPLIAKIIALGVNRQQAIARLVTALESTRIAGISTNRPWLLELLHGDPRFQENSHDLATADDVQVIETAPDPGTLAAATGIELENRRDSSSAWDASGPFRIVDPATVVLHGDEAGGWQTTIELPHDHESNTTMFCLAEDDGFELSTPHGRWQVKFGPQLLGIGESSISDGVLRAPMPGKVVSINVTAGQQVEEGDVVAVFEAMKIEISLAAPFSGQVTEVNATEGEIVGSNQSIVTIVELSNDQES